ncbi:MAG TPA: ribonuclease R [Synergistaceae bacterium]|jgi:hypothetical protein|nr:ribonuclease R [Synergistaceae bacterium]
MFDQKAMPETVLEIIRILYFSGRMHTPKKLQEALEKKDIRIETRTIRYHITSLEEKGLVQRFGNRGFVLSEEGVAKAKTMLVFDRVGGLAAETERLALDCDYSSEKRRGTIMVNTLLVGEEKMDRAMKILLEMAKSRVILSSRLAILKAGERIWNHDIPDGKNALIGVSSGNFDILLHKMRIPTETTATFLLRIEDNAPSGITDIISHTGTTLSPGELLIRGGYTSVSDILRSGTGIVTAAIKAFPSIYFDEVKSILDASDKTLFSDVVELKPTIPTAYQMSYKDRSKGYMLLYGGGNFFAPLIEQGITENLSISQNIYRAELMRPVQDFFDDPSLR